MDDLEKLEIAALKLHEAAAAIASVGIPGAELVAERLLDQMKSIAALIYVAEDM